MRKLALILAAFAGLAILTGCGAAEVDERDVKNWENEGRAPGDNPVDPNTGRDR